MELSLTELVGIVAGFLTTGSFIRHSAANLGINYLIESTE